MKSHSASSVRQRLTGFGVAALFLVTLGLVGCGPSEEDLAKGKERAALAAAQSEVVATLEGEKACTTGAAALAKWRADNQDAIDASNEWWNKLSDGTKDKIYEEFPAFGQANKDRIKMLVYCGSDADVWNPGA